MQVNFPEAMHYIQREELDYALDPSNSSYPHEILKYFQANAKIEKIQGDGDLNYGIEFELSGGHSPYHQVILIRDRTETLFFGGDVLPEGIQLVRNYIAKYDFDGRKSMELRKKYGRLAAEENWTCLYYHDQNKRPYSKVNQGPEGGFSLVYPE
jgi:glyoxylase-like metal-dependent hydrolase (beta-lactamase superfamily II)